MSNTITAKVRDRFFSSVSVLIPAALTVFIIILTVNLFLAGAIIGGIVGIIVSLAGIFLTVVISNVALADWM